MLLAAEVVSDIPIVGSALAGRAGATLDVLGMHLLAVATDVGADRGARDRATGGGDVLAAPAADLVTEDAANDGARDGRRHVGAASILTRPARARSSSAARVVRPRRAPT